MSMKRCSTVVWLTLVMFFGTSAHAAVITGGVWSPIVSPDNDGVPFYDGASYDGAECGVSWLLTTGNCGHVWSVNPSNNLAGLEYLNDGSGNAVPWSFTGNTLDGFTFMHEITAWADQGALEWYNTADPGMGTIFTGADVPGATANPALTAAWALRFTSSDGSYLSSEGPDYPQFALFRQVVGGQINYFVGIEDILNSGGAHVSDRDYNDMIVGFSQAAPVPEPTMLLLLGAGLVGAASRYRRR